MIGIDLVSKWNRLKLRSCSPGDLPLRKCVSGEESCDMTHSVARVRMKEEKIIDTYGFIFELIRK
jgi:hypothetical protein